jgi:hypothetical protein
VDTLAMHLAGSVGHPAAVLLSHQVPGFLPGLAEESGWYPSLRLLRQRPSEGWEAVCGAFRRTGSPSGRAAPSENKAPPKAGRATHHREAGASPHSMPVRV